jgi:hypothetical protein
MAVAVDENVRAVQAAGHEARSFRRQPVRQ